MQTRSTRRARAASPLPFQHNMTLTCVHHRACISKQRWSQAAFLRNLARDNVWDVIFPDNMLLAFHVVTKDMLSARVDTLGELYSLRDDLLFLGVDPSSLLSGDFVELSMRFARKINVTSDVYCVVKAALEPYTPACVRTHPMTCLFFPSRVRSVVYASLVPLAECTVDVRHADVISRIMSVPCSVSPQESAIRSLICKLADPECKDVMEL